MIKIKVSYERPEELQRVIRLLGQSVQTIRKAKEQRGQYKRAYISLRNTKVEHQNASI